jgi:hypothetical protein
MHREYNLAVKYTEEFQTLSLHSTAESHSEGIHDSLLHNAAENLSINPGQNAGPVEL